MKRLTLALVTIAGLAAPAAAQTLTVLLPAISFPDTLPTPSTKGCAPAPAKAVCLPQE